MNKEKEEEKELHTLVSTAMDISKHAATVVFGMGLQAALIRTNKKVSLKGFAASALQFATLAREVNSLCKDIEQWQESNIVVTSRMPDAR